MVTGLAAAAGGDSPTRVLSRLGPGLRMMLRSELEPGEPVVWIGQPDPRRFAAANPALMIFGGAWTAFAIFWTLGAAGFQAPREHWTLAMFPLFGLPFIAIGVGMLTMPWWGRLRAHRLAYVITDRRVIVLEHGRTRSVSSYGPAQLGALHRREYDDATGDLVLQRGQVPDDDGGMRTVEVALRAIHGVRGVERLVRQLAESAGGATPARR